MLHISFTATNAACWVREWGLAHLHVGLEIVFSSTAKGAQGALVAFQARVDDHVPLPVALAFDDQSANRTLEWFAAVLRRTLRARKNIIMMRKSIHFLHLHICTLQCETLVCKVCTTDHCLLNIEKN